MALDRKSKITAAKPLYFCYGGTHTFTLKAADHSAWVNQGVCLKGEPGTTLPLSAAPHIGAFQTFEESGAVWTINCPAKGAAAPVETFQLWSQTEYTSPAYKIDVSLGHHRLDFVDVSGNEQFQVIEYGEETTLNAREVSYYTETAMPFSAKWKLGEQELQPAEPDVNGWVTPLFFKPDTEADYLFYLTVPSLYFADGYYCKELPVRALALTPWGNNSTLEVNGKPVTDISKLGVICTRGKTNTLKLLNPDLLLKESMLTLSSASDLAKLGITIADFGVAKQLIGPEMSWPITSSLGSGKGGWFELNLACSKLKKDWENITGRIISGRLVDEVTKVEVGGRAISEVGALWFRNESALLTLTFEPWMRGLKVALDEVGGDNLQMAYRPSLKLPVEVPDSLELSWEVTSGENTGSFQLQAICEDSTTPLNINSRVISKISAEEFKTIRLNDVELADLNNPELNFLRGDKYELKLVGKPEGSLPGLHVALVPGANNPHLGMAYWPPLGEQNAQLLQANATAKWTITAGKNTSGFFDLQFMFIETGEVFPLPCRLLSKDLKDEGVIKFNDEAILQRNILLRGETTVVTLEPLPNSPLRGYPVSLNLLTVGGGLEPTDIVSDPDFDTSVTSHSWRVTGPAIKSGHFQLTLKGQDMQSNLHPANITLVSSDLADEITVMADGEEIPPNGFEFVGGHQYILKTVPKPGSSWAGLRASMNFNYTIGLGPNDVRISPEPGALNPSTEWKMTWTKDIDVTGTFQLSVRGDSVPVPLTFTDCKLVQVKGTDER
ncbi:hypothetical protein NYP20_14860 [Pseudomonas sp. N3-W]|uniref:hypothetical protein n=1 Tax=Pseudomonas sp. N3-W TaxID=2975049 RepID=UPI00217E6124|nr:hypothetical protein [Pseudomonas sp. N3-W]UWF52167.1 hypothetical protein NYP20_14860 [Pseudomonas sp. N3-W]